MLFEVFLGATLIIIVILAVSLMLLRVRLMREAFGSLAPQPSELKDASRVLAGDERRVRARREAPAEAEAGGTSTPIQAELGIRYPQKVFAEGQDYTLWVDLGKIGYAPIPVGAGEAEAREALGFIAEEATPEVEITVSSTAFTFDTQHRRVILDLQRVVSVPFVFSPKEDSLGERQIMVRIAYKGREVKAAMVKVHVEKYVIDGLSYVYVKRLQDLSALLTAVSGIATVILGIFGF